MTTLRYIDTHSHIHFADFDRDRDAVFERMHREGVGTIVIGTSIETSMQVVHLAKKRNNVWACIGIHPNTHEDFDVINTRVNSGEISIENVVAVGECGLDYFRLYDMAHHTAYNNKQSTNKNTDTDNTNKNDSDMLANQYIEKEKKRQKKLFNTQIEFAIQHKLPLMLHIRSSNNECGKSTNDAHDDALEILQEHKNIHGDALRLHCHFTTFGVDMAKKFIALDKQVTFGIPGVVTYKNGKEVQELVKWLPLEKILSETDAPYAAPVPHRGKRNEPIFVIDTINAIAGERKEDEEAVRIAMLKNAQNIFNLEV